MSSSNQDSAIRSPWLSGPIVDSVIGCGAWSFPFIAIAWALSGDHRITLAATFYFLAIFCNQPHYMATIYRAYGGKSEFRKYRFFSLYLTVFVALAGIISYAIPEFVPWLVTVYLLWSPWHYTGQNFGISMMMARRAGIAPTRTARNLLHLSYMGSYSVWIVSVLSKTPDSYFALSIEIPPEIHLPILFLGFATFFAAGVGSFWILGKSASSRKELLAPALLHSTQFFWFLLPNIVDRFTESETPTTYYTAGALAFMHCAQYLWITSYYAKRESSNSPGSNGDWKPLAYFATLIIGGIALFTPGPWIVSTVFGQDLFESAIIFAALVNIHHFMLDGAIWKLRDGHIARLLLGSRSDEKEEHDATFDLLAWLKSKEFGARATRWSIAIALICVALLDQAQNIFTLQTATEESVAIAETLNANDTRVHLRRAHQALEKGNIEEAISKLEAGLALNDRNLALIHPLARIRFVQGELDEAYALYGRIRTISPKDLSAQMNSALIAYSKKDWPNAITHFERAFEIEPDRWQTRQLLGQALFENGNHAMAIPHLESYLALILETDQASSLNDALAVARMLRQSYGKTGDEESASALQLTIDAIENRAMR